MALGCLLKAKYVVADKILEDAAVAIDGDLIEAVGDSSELARRFRGYERIDTGRSAVIPGLINTHTHAAMTIFRGYAEELGLHEWLEKIWRIEARLDGEAIYECAKLAAAESLLFGTTTINSMYFYRDESSEPQAFYDAGIRATVAHTPFEQSKGEDLKTTARLAERWHGAGGGRIRVAVAPHAPYSVAPATLQACRQLADELNAKLEGEAPILVHLHLAETADEGKLVRQRFGGDTTKGVARYLGELGFLKDDVVAAHCIHLSDEDYIALRTHRVNVSTNPISNLKVGMGIAPVSRLLQEGVNVSLGTDGPASNNALDMFETMKIASLLQKGVSGDPTRISARTTFDMATINGARALKAEGRIGRVAKGFKADLVVLDLVKPHAAPAGDLYSHLVYTAKCGDVSHVFVDGKLVVEERRITTFNVEELVLRVNRLREALLTA